MKSLRLLSAAAAAAFVASAAFAQEAPVAAPAAPAPAPAADVAADAAAPAPVAAAPAAPAYKPIAPAGDLVETAKASGQFTTFVKALDATNLTAVLKNNKGLTVFAPTDAAFAALPAGELERLMDPDNASELQSLLVYHIVNAPVDSTKLKGAKGPVKTVAGTDVLLDGSGDQVMANSATVLQADVRATNGIIHVVDHVLTPGDPVIAKAKAEAAEASAAPQQSPAA
ncbi:MAG TPA: fasciclin domain-containing protein [Caulobacteraceae bacterium]